MLHPNVQAEYFDWIRTCIKDRSAIGPFCDWLDEHSIRSQKWREVLAFVDKVKYFKVVETDGILWTSLVTCHKVITIRLHKVNKKSRKIFVGITNRFPSMTNMFLETSMHLHPQYDYQKV